MDKFSVLQQYFGHSSFRPGQEQVVDAIVSGQDVLGVMPTGAGKSVCYQVPAMLMPGLTLVISPLISLMQDQVAALEEEGVHAACLNSALPEGLYSTILRAALEGDYKILYVAPERLLTDSFLYLAMHARIAFVAVDEAHCVSQWGQDFRPSYLKIAEFISRLPYRPVIGAFTATATEQVKQDIIALLQLNQPFTLTTGFDRPNLYFGVARPRDKERYIEEYILDHRDRSGIVYCATRKSVESVCKELRSVGISATRYHAGLTPEERSKNQEDFVYDRKRVMVATNAFGMGIDKSNVSFVLHYNMPKNLENYYQEAGRAGRDGERAECILLFSLGDVQTAKYFIQNSHDNDELTPEQAEAAARRDRERLDVMVGYCKTTRCLRSYLLDYFGEHHTGGCGNCSNCTGEFVQTDITTEAQKILSGVARIQKSRPGGLGVVALVQMLRGAKDQNTLERGLDQFPTYGIMRDVPPQRMRLYLDALQEQGYLAETGDEFPVITLTAKAPAVLFHGEQVTMQERAATAQETQAKRRASRKKTAARTALSEADDSLLASLKTLRSELAQKKQISLLFESGEERLVMAFDTDKIDKIFVNLISNAIKFTPEEGQVLVSLRRKDTGDVEVMVADTGIGIPDGDLPHKFERFYQVEEHTGLGTRGTGIGLMSVKECVELHRGHIEVMSRDKQGTTFIVTLPIVNEADYDPAESETEETAEQLPAEPEARPYSGHEFTVLLDEDNEDMRSSL